MGSCDDNKARLLCERVECQVMELCVSINKVFHDDFMIYYISQKNKLLLTT